MAVEPTLSSADPGNTLHPTTHRASWGGWLCPRGDFRGAPNHARQLWRFTLPSVSKLLQWDPQSLMAALLVLSACQGSSSLCRLPQFPHPAAAPGAGRADTHPTTKKPWQS